MPFLSSGPSSPFPSPALLALGRRRWMSFLWFGVVLLACGASMLGPDVAISQAMRQWPAFVHKGFRVVTDAGLGHWYLVPTGAAALGLFACRWVLPETVMGRDRAAWLQRLAWALVFIFLAVALSGLITDGLKVLIGRARPKLLEQAGFFGFSPWNFRADYQSFPSGHATTAAAVALAVTYLVPRCWVLALGFAVIIGASRVVLNAHYLADVMGGAAVAGLTTWWLREWFAGHQVLFRYGAGGQVQRVEHASSAVDEAGS